MDSTVEAETGTLPRIMIATINLHSAARTSVTIQGVHTVAQPIFTGTAPGLWFPSSRRRTIINS